MFDDEPPQLRAMLDDPNHRPPGARLILALLILLPVCWALVVAIYVFAIRVLGPALAAIGSAL